ncbi:hypothetical protein HY468_01545, partial [Candidatus Roizmanbacteria bacterium]|nr:hypothetical protein [Candidatus Roizmanbacteria bacterium]
MNYKRVFSIFGIMSIGVFLFVLTSQTTRINAAETIVATLVATHDTSHWTPPSPDPAGITYNPITNTLLITDSEVEEMPIYQGKNVFESTLTGDVVSTTDTTFFSNEPTDIAINTNNGHYFFSDDNKKKVYEVDLGLDGVFGTGDDVLSFFSTADFNSTDPEGIAYNQGKLYIADGVGKEVYVIDPGTNGLFDGVIPTGDDQVTNFDVEVFGIVDPEGIEYNPDNDTLFVLDSKRTNKIVVEVTTQGELVRSIDISAAGSRKPA